MEPRLTTKHIKAVKNHLRFRLFQRFGIKGMSANKLQKLATLAVINGKVKIKSDGKQEIKTLFMGKMVRFVYCPESDLIFTAYK